MSEMGTGRPRAIRTPHVYIGGTAGPFWVSRPITAQLAAAANAGHVFTGWRGYFTGRAVHIRKTDLAPPIVR